MITEEQFNQEIAKLNNKLNAIYQILKEQSNTIQPIVTKPQSVPTGDLVLKNTINWDAFNTISDPNDLNIATGMHSNKYPTITSGQFKLLRDIASKHKIDISI
jgi:hypothetical protein